MNELEQIHATLEWLHTERLEIERMILLRPYDQAYYTIHGYLLMKIDENEQKAYWARLDEWERS